MQYFRFANWQRHQHYADRNPPWAKLYACILDIENDWYRLTDAQSGQLVRIIALACRRENTMPYSNDLIADEIHASGPVDLTVFRDMIEVYPSREECLRIERLRLAQRQGEKSSSNGASKPSSKHAISPASAGASKPSSKNAVLRGQRSEIRDQKEPSGSGSSVPALEGLGTETEQLSRESAADAAETLPSREAPAAAGPVDRNAARDQEWAAWTEDLVTRSDDPEPAVRAYVEALVKAVAAYYAQAGGSFTPTRKARLASILEKCVPDVQMMAIEIYVDRHAGNKDERYMAGVARRLQKLTQRERENEIARHRKHMGGVGLLDSVTEGNPDVDHTQVQQRQPDAFADDRDGAALG